MLLCRVVLSFSFFLFSFLHLIIQRGSNGFHKSIQSKVLRRFWKFAIGFFDHGFYRVKWCFMFGRRLVYNQRHCRAKGLTIDQELQRLIHIFGDEIGRKMHAINRAEKIAAIEQKVAPNDLKISTAIDWLFNQAITERRQIQKRRWNLLEVQTNKNEGSKN